MTPSEELLLVVALLYLVECGHWLPRTAVPFRERSGGKARVVSPAEAFGNDSAAWIASPPLPPFGRVFVAGALPFSVSPHGLLSHVATAFNPGARPPQPGRWLALDAVSSIAADGREVRVDGSRFVLAASPLHARALASWLRELAGLDRDRRFRAIAAALARSLDARAAAERIEQARRLGRLPLLLGHALFGFAFLLAPAVALGFGLAAVWPHLLAIALALVVAQVLLFRHRFAALYPGEPAARRSAVLHMALAPLSAVRAADRLARDAVVAYHPLAVGRALLDDRGFESLAAAVLRDLAHPLEPVCPLEDEAARTTEAEFRSLLRAEVETFLRRHGTEPERLLAPPPPDGAGPRSWCRRCGAQFAASLERCPDCGLPLAPLACAAT